MNIGADLRSLFLSPDLGKSRFSPSDNSPPQLSDIQLHYLILINRAQQKGLRTYANALLELYKKQFPSTP